MKKFCGDRHTRPCFRMPEVPLTKSRLYECMQYCELPKLRQNNPTLQAMNQQMKAVKGLSDWYTNHLTAMHALQTYKDFHKVSTQGNRNVVNASKPKQLAVDPHLDLQNYLTSLISRQRQMRSLGKVGKVWEKYFEKAIPGWNELKQIRKKDSGLLKNETRKLLAGEKFRREDKTQPTVPPDKQNSSENPFELQSSTSAQSSLKSLNLHRVAKGKMRARSLVMPLTSENKVRDYFSNNAALRNEQVGNVNNEILFTHIYGKYLSKVEQSESGKRKERKQKLNRTASSSDKTVLKEPIGKYKEAQSYKNNKSSKNSRDSLTRRRASLLGGVLDKNNQKSGESFKDNNKKQNSGDSTIRLDGATRAKQKVLESLLLNWDKGKDNNGRRSLKNHLFNNELTVSKRSLSGRSHRKRSTHSVFDIGRITVKRFLQKSGSRKLFKSRTGLYTLQAQQRSQKLKRLTRPDFLRSSSRMHINMRKPLRKPKPKRPSSAPNLTVGGTDAKRITWKSSMVQSQKEEASRKKFIVESGSPKVEELKTNNKKLKTKNKSKPRQKLIDDVVHAEWTSDKSQEDLEYSRVYGTSTFKPSPNTIPEVVE